MKTKKLISFNGLTSGFASLTTRFTTCLLKSLFIIEIRLSCFLFTTLLIFFYVSLLGDEDFSIEKEVSLPSDMFETLERLKENPLALNSATYEEILQIPYITPLLAMRIEVYREEGNSFSNTNDLLKIAGFNEPLLRKISPYITLKKKIIWKGVFRWKIIIINSYPPKEEYTGSPFKVSNRMGYSNGTITLGGNTYKDAYEKSYIDFYTLYCYVQKNGYSLIIGDYAIDTGEKLILGYPGFVFKSSGMVKGREYFIKPYSSGFEDYSLRGCAFKKDWKILTSGLFVSYKKEDATIEDGIVKKVIYETGYHRSETEIKKRDRIKERLIGGIIGTGNENFRITTSSLFAEYSQRVEPDSTNYYSFSGKRYGLMGVHGVYNRENISLWSEFAYSLYTKGRGLIIGTSARPHNTTISLLYRDYSESFYSPRAFAFCETEVRNEKGFYTYITSRLPQHFYFSGYIDIFSRPNPTYFNLLSTEGYEAFASVGKKIMNSNLYVRYKRKEKNSYQWQDMSLNYERQNFRLSMKTKIGKTSNFKILWEGEIFSVPYIDLQEFGNLFSLSFRAEVFENTKFESGLVFYETDSYYSRIYLFLNDIPGSMYTRPFYGKGKDFYLLVKEKVLDNLRIYGRFEINAKVETEKIFKLGLEWR